MMCPKLITLSSESNSLFDDMTSFTPIDVAIQRAIKANDLKGIFDHFS